MLASAAPPSNGSILIVDDDVELRGMVADYLSRQGYRVDVADSARQMDEELSEHAVDLIILDVMLPDEDGLSVCRRMRRPEAPAIIMVSGLAHEADRVVGLEFGADDYMCKPFGTRELLARVRAVLRRRPVATTPMPPIDAAASFAGLLVQPAERRLLCAASGQSTRLTAQEFALLQRFLAQPRHTLDRNNLADLDHEGDADARMRVVDVRVSRLRRKLHRLCGADIIQTSRGVGYRLNADVTTL